jgi:regulatory protein
MATKQTFRQRGIRKSPKLDENLLWEYALRALSQRAHSANDIKQKLSRRAESPDGVTAVMAKLREYGMADDHKFSETFASSRLQNNGFGRFRVLQDLRARKISSGVAEKAVEKIFQGVDESDLIEKFLARKYRNTDLPIFLAEDKNMASAYRRLRLAGFSSRASLAALKEHSKRPQDFDPPDEND